MTKAEIANEISRQTGLDRRAVVDVIEKFMVVVKESVAKGDNVYLRGFGAFELIERAQKPARNINKGETIILPARKIPKFKAYPEFKEAVDREQNN